MGERKFKVGDRVRVKQEYRDEPFRLQWITTGVCLMSDMVVVGYDQDGDLNLAYTGGEADAMECEVELIDPTPPFAQAFIADIDARGGLDNIGDDALEVLGVWYAKAKEVEK